MGSIPENIEELVRLVENAGDEEGASHRFSLHNEQVARLEWTEKVDRAYPGYPSAGIILEPPRPEQALVAALTVLQGSYMTPEQLRRTQYRTHYALPAAQYTREAIEALCQDADWPDPPAGMEKANNADTWLGFSHGYIEDLLRHYRPDYEEISSGDWAALVNRVLEKANDLMNAARQMVLCLQHADPIRGLPTQAVTKAGRDVRAAELRDIEELSYVQIGEELGIGQSENDKVRGDNYRVRTQLVPNGRETLQAALGTEGYRRHAESSKAERKRWQSLSEEQKRVETWAEQLSVPAENMHRILEGAEQEFLEELSALGQNKHPQAVVARAAWHTLQH